MNAAISTLLCTTTLLAFAAPVAAQAHRPGKTGSRTPVEVPPRPASGACGHAACADGVLDQGTDRCIRASSTPTFGLFFPYPGIDNTFVGPAFVGGGEANRATGRWSVIGGGRRNAASGTYATVGGGGGRYYGNTASGDLATVGGGYFNMAAGFYATVAGGAGNIASKDGGTVCGGTGNTASGSRASVGGGVGNIAAGGNATVAGGERNTASGTVSTVPGGFLNTARGAYSFAAGRRALASHQGSFVWGDSQVVEKPSSAADEFTVYCSGGARFFSNSAASTGVLLAPGGGSWSAVSDRAAKENIEPVDPRAVLEGVVAMPLSTWNYKEQDDSVRHLGPMAQDFRAAFGLGVSDKLIDTVDPDGVALAAIQGLNAKLEERDAEIAALRSRQAAMEAQLAALVDSLEERAASRSDCGSDSVRAQ